MKLKNISVEVNDPLERLYDVEEISPDDIVPSENFLKFIRELKGYSFLNVFTLDELTKQVKQRFTS